MQQILEAPIVEPKICPQCGYKDEGEFIPRRMKILQNLANRASDPTEKRADSFAHVLFQHGYEQKEIDPFAVLKLLIENADMPEDWKSALVSGISDGDTPLLEKPAQIAEWRVGLSLNEDDFPVQLQNGSDSIALRNQNEWEIFNKARMW